MLKLQYRDYAKIVDLERANLEFNSYLNIINHMMDTHKNDASFLKSAIWQAYMQEYKDTCKEFDAEKAAFGRYLIQQLNHQGINVDDAGMVDWEIPDFTVDEVIIKTI